MGRPQATRRVTSGGAAQSKGALAIAGEIAPGSPFAWAGAMWYPGPTPMAPANLAGGDGITFWAKGDGAEYRLMVFTQSKGRMPLTKTFVAGPEWKRFRFAFTDFEGSEGRDVTGILFAAGPAPGTFELSVDDVGLE